MKAQYAHVLLFLILGLSFPLINFFISSLVRPKSKDAVQKTPYECGMLPVGTAYQPMSVGFYVFALLFVIFDLESLFLYPWAVAFKSMGTEALASMALFVGILTLAFLYIWKKGALRWGDR